MGNGPKVRVPGADMAAFRTLLSRAVAEMYGCLRDRSYQPGGVMLPRDAFLRLEVALEDLRELTRPKARDED